MGKRDKFAELGDMHELNDFEGKAIYVLKLSSAQKTFVHEKFIADGCMIIDGETGLIIACRFRFTKGLEQGDDSGGLKHKAASAIAQAGPCLAIKCSEDNCAVDGVGKGELKVFPAQKSPISVGVPPPNMLKYTSDIYRCYR